MRLSSTSVKRFPSHYRRRLWISPLNPLNPPISMNGTHGQSDYRTTIFVCDQQSRNTNHEGPHNEEKMQITWTWEGQLDKHLSNSTSNQLEIRMQWTSITCPPKIEQTWWRKDYASNVESLDRAKDPQFHLEQRGGYTPLQQPPQKMKGKETHTHVRMLLAQMEKEEKEEIFNNASKEGF